MLFQPLISHFILLVLVRILVYIETDNEGHPFGATNAFSFYLVFFSGAAMSDPIHCVQYSMIN